MGDSESQVLLVVAEKDRDEGLGLLSTRFFQIYHPLEEGSPQKNSTGLYGFSYDISPLLRANEKCS